MSRLFPDVSGRGEAREKRRKPPTSSATRHRFQPTTTLDACALPDRTLKWMFSAHKAPRAFSARRRDDKIAP